MAPRPPRFVATNGNDTFTLTTGNDVIDGLAGTDTAIFAASRAQINLAKSGATITATGQGTDQLTNIERLQFNDGTLAFDTTGNAGQVYRLYKAALDRTPDQSGLGYWIKQLDAGKGDIVGCQPISSTPPSSRPPTAHRKR